MTPIDPSPVQSPAAAAGAMKPSEALRAARELITPEGAWIKGSEALNGQGKRVDANDPDAVCFCAYGAIWNISGRSSLISDISSSYLESAIDEMEETEDVMYIDEWNDADRRTQSDVISTFLRAEELAIAEEN